MNRILCTFATVAVGTTAFAQISKQPTSTLREKLAMAGVQQPPQISLQGGALALVGGADDCTTPDAISGTGTFTVNNTTATTGTQGQAEALCLFAGSTQLYNDVWMTWNAPTTASYRISLCASGITADTRIAVYDGTTCPAAAAIACVDDACGLVTRVDFNAVAGQDYVFQFGAYLATTARYNTNFTLDLTPPVTPDDCSLAQPISGTGTFTVDQTAATTGTQGQTEPLCLNAGSMALYNDVWFDWTAGCSGPTTVSLCGGGTTTDSKIAVYDGAGCPTTAAIACNDDSCGLVSLVTFTAVGGQHYTLQMGTYTAATGRFAGTFTIATTCTEPGTSYCGNGDPARTTACPCGNTGLPANGCASSFNPNGANITATGTVAADDVVLQGSGMNATGNCIFLKGDVSTAAGLTFGDGVRCTDGTLIRLRAKPLTAGASSFPDSVETVTLSQRGGTPVGSGLTASYTVYYRNAAAAFCPPETFNAANGYLITW